MTFMTLGKFSFRLKTVIERRPDNAQGCGLEAAHALQTATLSREQSHTQAEESREQSHTQAEESHEQSHTQAEESREQRNHVSRVIHSSMIADIYNYTYTTTTAAGCN